MDTEFKDIPPSVTPRNGTGIIVNEETRIETIIIILWVTGGVLLVALLIMLFFLLKSKRKGGRSIHRRPSLFHIDARGGYPRTGGVNHGYTSYDEIWTWIPVVRGDQDQCQPTSTRLTRTPSNASTLHREPPPYSVATGGRTTHTPIAPSTGNSVSNVAMNQNHLTNIHPSSTSTSSSSACRGDNSVVVSSPNTNSDHVVISSSNENRVHSNDYCRGHQTRGNYTVRQNRTRDVRSPHSSRRHGNQNNPNEVARQHVRPNPVTDTQTNNSHSRTGSGNVHEHTHTHTQRPFEYNADEGIYSYITGADGRRVWCDIPLALLDEDGPPPYAPPPDYPGHRRYYPNPSRQNQNGSAPLMRLDYDYF